MVALCPVGWESLIACPPILTYLRWRATAYFQCICLVQGNILNITSGYIRILAFWPDTYPLLTESYLTNSFHHSTTKSLQAWQLIAKRATLHSLFEFDSSSSRGEPAESMMIQEVSISGTLCPLASKQGRIQQISRVT